MKTEEAQAIMKLVCNHMEGCFRGRRDFTKPIGRAWTVVWAEEMMVENDELRIRLTNNTRTKTEARVWCSMNISQWCERERRRCVWAASGEPKRDEDWYVELGRGWQKPFVASTGETPLHDSCAKEIRRLREHLKWYGDKAQALAQGWEVDRTVRELKMDAGSRAGT